MQPNATVVSAGGRSDILIEKAAGREWSFGKGGEWWAVRWWTAREQESKRGREDGETELLGEGCAEKVLLQLVPDGI